MGCKYSGTKNHVVFKANKEPQYRWFSKYTRPHPWVGFYLRKPRNLQGVTLGRFLLLGEGICFYWFWQFKAPKDTMIPWTVSQRPLNWKGRLSTSQRVRQAVQGRYGSPSTVAPEDTDRYSRGLQKKKKLFTWDFSPWRWDTFSFHFQFAKPLT